ncbi:MAG: class II glutamine amidotransferase [Bacteroidota bacterium]
MCRFVAYLGEPILAEDLLTKPRNSLIHQSYDAQEAAEPLNGDGFGLGWYTKQIRDEPGLFRSITPAWNNQNLKVNAGIMKSNCFLAHVRAATEGGVSLENSHPFRYNQYLMMQNGGVEGFKEIKRALINKLDDQFYQWIEGQTDSEHVFALYMQVVAAVAREKKAIDLPLRVLSNCFKEAFHIIEEIKKEKAVGGPSVYNMVISDGRRLVATRYSTDPDNCSRTLYFARGKKYVCEGNHCHMLPLDGGPGSILVVSEKLDEYVDEWIPVEDNHALLVNEDLTYELVNLE